MAENILVTLKRGDRVGEIVPYIEEVAKPGTKVVFLMRYPVTISMEYMELVQGILVAKEWGRTSHYGGEGIGTEVLLGGTGAIGWQAGISNL